MTGGGGDPRPARSRARLMEAATALLRSGGPSAVTIDAVTRHANVARATLYRHFPSSNDLVAAAFMSLIPPAPMPPADGTLRERLIAVVGGWADAIAEAIAARAGAPITPEPYRPVLRGALLTGAQPRYLHAGPGSGPGEISERPLWWPPSKIAARHLGPYLAALEHTDLRHALPPDALPVETVPDGP